jgi:hypothetical protein
MNNKVVIMNKVSKSLMVFAASVAFGACAADTDPMVMAEGQDQIPDSPITEREQYEGSLDPQAATDHDGREPVDGVDGPIEGLAPRTDSSSISDLGDTSIHVDALAACRPATGYSRGNQVSICVTEVEGKLVEYRTAEAFLRMQAAARRSGVQIHIVSGWRTMERQRQLYADYRAGRGNLAARPGYSNHQNGLALDLNASASGVYSWLANHGGEYGFRRTVPSENWHWERPAGSQGPVTGGTADSTCFSSTVNRNMPVRACVQSRSDMAWYQCVGGVWRPGRGTNGACSSTVALGMTPPPPPPVARTCFSSTLNREQALGVCVQSRSDSRWYQCSNNGWVSSTGSSGPAGSCTASTALR